MQVLIPPDIAQQSDCIVLQISQRNIQNCDTSEYVTLLHGNTDKSSSNPDFGNHYLMMEKIFRDSMDSATNHSTGSFQLSKQDRVPTHMEVLKI